MNNEGNQIFYRSSTHLENSRIQAVAVYCSDGRFGKLFDEFMCAGLGLPCYDRLAIPGGIAGLAHHFSLHGEEEGISAQLQFLIQGHKLKRVVLIAHEGCAFYTDRLQIPSLQLESQQIEDMKISVKCIQSIGSALLIESFFARKKDNGTIQFEFIDL